MLFAAIAAAIVADPAWGTLKLPDGFATASDLPVEGSAAAAPGRPGARKRLLAVFEEAAPADAGAFAPAVLAVSVVDEPLPSQQGLSDSVFAATVAHMRQGLGLTVRLEKPMRRGDRVEVAAHVEEDSAPHTVRLGFYPTRGRYFVVWASYPQRRGVQLGPAMDEVFDSFRPPDASVAIAPITSPLARALGLAVVGLVLIAAVRLWRRRTGAAQG